MITFYSDNLVDQATITSPTENALFPLSNIKDPRRTKVFRSRMASSHVVLDFLETSEFDSIVLVDDPIRGFGLSTITVQANNSNEWSSPAFESPMTVNLEHGVGILELDAVQSYRFVRLVITSTMSYFEIANLFIGKKTKTSRGLSFGWSVRDDDISIIKENRYGQKFSDIIGRQRVFSGNLNNLTLSDVDLMNRIGDTKGKTKPFFIKIGDECVSNDPKRLIAMVYFTNIPSITHRRFNNFSYPLQFDEAR